MIGTYILKCNYDTGRINQCFISDGNAERNKTTDCIEMDTRRFYKWQSSLSIRRSYNCLDIQVCRWSWSRWCFIIVYRKKQQMVLLVTRLMFTVYNPMLKHLHQLPTLSNQRIIFLIHASQKAYALFRSGMWTSIILTWERLWMAITRMRMSTLMKRPWMM